MALLQCHHSLRLLVCKGRGCYPTAHYRRPLWCHSMHVPTCHA